MDDLSHVDIKRLLIGIDEVKHTVFEMNKAVNRIERVVEDIKNKVQQLESKGGESSHSKHIV